MISNSPMIDRLIVLYGSQFSIFLFNKEERCCIGTLGGLYCSLFQVFVDELL